MVKGNTRACAINKNSINCTSGVMYNMKGTIDGSANCGTRRQCSQEPRYTGSISGFSDFLALGHKKNCSKNCSKNLY